MKPIFLTIDATELNPNGEIVLTKARFDSISQRIYDSGVADGKNLALADLYKRHHENVWNATNKVVPAQECSGELLGKKSTLLEMIKNLPSDQILQQFVNRHIKETDTFEGILANAINELLVTNPKPLPFTTMYEGAVVTTDDSNHTHEE